ncbi:MULTISPECIES: phosphoenolpyruvate--protein phosphotransferase [unclassified Ruminococcus]|uniref:phosphoenolpyruvate--protein phosphotransferase n=1 Tax=unclassified Ruminococcus TaxID=2608920 RepID=UPI00210E818A|nr:MULTISPECIES: phosphoenolpyruvate--protein phosphotransferase [unclassified Ruminococcus]MCQ4022914.1 phosphoenolpyruvate--protein phosphotransferase [Ruminococcus sp. zg-924]MCQ4115270.1 phosphoenolpyruvate--protein phosphotransferase [Ruminococcus sp. zg-921]
MFKGIAASKGIGIGRVLIIKEQDLSYEANSVIDTEAEVERFKAAVAKFSTDTEKKAADIEKNVGQKEAEIIRGHILMIQDPFVSGEIENKIKAGDCAEKALDEICSMFAAMFASTGDELTMQRATDIEDIRKGILSILLDREEADISTCPEGTVIVVGDLTPSMTASINKDNIAAIVTETGGYTSHSAILARALEIPAVLSVSDILSQASDGDEIIVDGSKGVVIKSPSEQQKSEYTSKRNKYLADKEALKAFIGKETATSDGVKAELCCNIGKPTDVHNVLESDGEGIGLFRTEFLFMDSTSLPSEEQQFEAYSKVAKAMNGKPVIIRTLDIGGDKDVPYLGLESEDNPFLGYRAVRYCLSRPDVYKPQLRALLRAAVYGDIRIMVPLVTTVEEMRQVKALVEQIKSELDSEGVKYKKDVKIGAMAETAAAGVIPDLLAEECDFFSIGTNDLTGYTMCVDRGNSKVAYLYSAYNPAVLRMIRNIITEGKKAGIPVGMCGEAAADPLLIPMLIAFGLDEYSVSPTSVLSARKTISQWSLAEAQALADKVMKLKTEKEVKEMLEANVKN